jgi:hypothetical protein
MAKKKRPQAKQAGDRHSSGFMVRLPEWHRAVLEILKRKNRRAYTEEVQMALEKHYKTEGVDVPKPPPTST